MSSLMMFPATLALKTLPIPWAKIDAFGTLESKQPATEAKGNCPVAVCFT